MVAKNAIRGTIEAAEQIGRGSQGRRPKRGPDRVGRSERKSAERRHQEGQRRWIGIVEQDRPLGPRRVFHGEKCARVSYRGRRAGGDEARGRIQSDEVVGGGLPQPAHECDQPGGRDENGRERDAR